MENCYYPFINTPLPYDYNALEPYIDEKTMHIHHDRHLETYIKNLNAALEKSPQLQNKTLEQLIRNASGLPCKIRTVIKNNAGGVYNHRFYFEGLSPDSEKEPGEKLLIAINQCFGNFGNFKQEFKATALSVFGSGYAWLVCGRGGLRIVTTPNQNSPVENGLSPILCIDVWEHAYYLKHYNLRADYIDDWFNVVNWCRAEELYCKNK